MLILIAIILVFLFGLVCMYLNIVVYKKNAYIARHINTEVPRNIDRLIIGDFCNTEELVKDKVCVCKQSPIRLSNEAIVILAKRLFSLLDENSGILTIVQKSGKHQATGVNVFDLPYLHENTIADLRLEKKRKLCKFPLLLSPIGSLRILLKCKGSSNLTKEACPIDSLVSFCELRNIKLEYYTIYE